MPPARSAITSSTTGSIFSTSRWPAPTFPRLSCNIFKPDGSFYVKPWLVLEPTLRDEAGAEQTLRIGIIGFTPPQIMQWDQSHLAGPRDDDRHRRSRARSICRSLRAQGVDLVVALCHSGISRKARRSRARKTPRWRWRKVGGIDAMFLGHQHLLLPGADFAGIDGVDVAAGALYGVPAFMPGFWGSHLGAHRSDSSERSGRPGASPPPGSRRGRSIARDERRGDAARRGRCAKCSPPRRPAHDETLAYVRSPVGDIASPIHSFFALVADDPSVQIVNAAQTWYVRRLAATMPALQACRFSRRRRRSNRAGAAGPDYYTDVKAGPIAIKNVADIYLYPNTLRAVKIDGATLARMAGALGRRLPAHRSRRRATEQPLIDPAFRLL